MAVHSFLFRGRMEELEEGQEVTLELFGAVPLSAMTPGRALGEMKATVHDVVDHPYKETKGSLRTFSLSVSFVKAPGLPLDYQGKATGHLNPPMIYSPYAPGLVQFEIEK